MHVCLLFLDPRQEPSWLGQSKASWVI